MESNLGEIDRVARIILSIILIALGLTFEIWLAFFGIIILLSGIIGWCPAYTLFKKATDKNFEKSRSNADEAS